MAAGLAGAASAVAAAPGVDGEPKAADSMDGLRCLSRKARKG